MAILLKFYIWKEYTNTTYGDHLANPKWWKGAEQEWIGLGYEINRKLKFSKERMEIIKIVERVNRNDNGRNDAKGKKDNEDIFKNNEKNPKCESHNYSFFDGG